MTSVVVNNGKEVNEVKKIIFISKILTMIFTFFIPLILINCAVKGGFYKAPQENSPGVILLHGWIRPTDVWDDLAWRLKKQGISVYALNLPQSKLDEMLKVVDEGFNYLLEEKVDPNRIALIGESTGANLALWYAAKNPRVRTIVLLSPGYRYRIPISWKEMVSYGERPILIITSHKDVEYPQSASDSEVLLKYAKGKKELKFAPGGHGIGMFDRDVFGWILSWLRDNL